MPRLAWICVSLFLLADADVPQIYRLRQASSQQTAMPATKESLPVLPDLGQQPQKPEPAKPAAKAATLQPRSRLSLVRFISGEFFRAVKAIPGGRRGFVLPMGKPIDEKRLQQAVSVDGAAVSPGDTAQITRIQFRDTQIVLDINGGGRGKTRWRDRIQIEATGAPRPTVSTTTSDPNAPSSNVPGVIATKGATLILDYGRPLPDMTADEFKRSLANLIDFSKQRSAALLYADTLPPAMKKAVAEKRAVVGMDREMVLAAIGKPDHKVRERGADGVETEDWIYGNPPGKTIFVRFAGDHVVKVQQFPQ